MEEISHRELMNLQKVDEVAQVEPPKSFESPAAPSSGTSYFLKIILSVFMLLVVGVGVYLYYDNSSPAVSDGLFEEGSDAECPLANTLPLYGCDSYEEFISKRSSRQVQVDEDFLKSILETAKGDPLAAQKGILAVGINYLKNGDIAVARKRANQVWLIDQSNYNSSWLFALTYFKENRNEEALLFLKKALNAYDQKYEYAPGDHSRLVCDVARGLLATAASSSGEVQIQKIQEAVSLIMSEIRAKGDEVPYHCYLHLSGVAYSLGNKSEAVTYLREAIKKEPSLRSDEAIRARIQLLGENPDSF